MEYDTLVITNREEFYLPTKDKLEKELFLSVYPMHQQEGIKNARIQIIDSYGNSRLLEKIQSGKIVPLSPTFIGYNPEIQNKYEGLVPTIHSVEIGTLESGVQKIAQEVQQATPLLKVYTQRNDLLDNESYTPSQISRLIGISSRTVSRWVVEDEEIKIKKSKGGHLRIERENLHSILHDLGIYEQIEIRQPIYTTTEAAQLLGVSARTIIDFCEGKNIPAEGSLHFFATPGRRHRKIPHNNLIDFLSEYNIYDIQKYTTHAYTGGQIKKMSGRTDKWVRDNLKRGKLIGLRIPGSEHRRITAGTIYV
ncbi:MAG: hypothetical protein ACI83O_000063 [Patescibacteria group bacterium]|jgi:plasmid maintenance system antidote protein VapI